MTKNELSLCDYLDMAYPGITELDYNDACANSWAMFERSIGYPPEIVEAWANEKGIRLYRLEPRMTMEKVWMESTNVTT